MRVLIAVASKHGGTLEIATRVGGVLTARGHPARVQDAATVQGLGDVDAVVLSSAIYFTRWLPAAVQFVERHEDGLRRPRQDRVEAQRTTVRSARPDRRPEPPPVRGTTGPQPAQSLGTAPGHTRPLVGGRNAGLVAG